ncbi:hypothetical protein GCM10018952_34910 [Streptosporangium vulgare]
MTPRSRAAKGAEGGEGAVLPVATHRHDADAARPCPLTVRHRGPGALALEGMVSPIVENQLGVGSRRGPDKITDEGREQLRMLGFNV